MRRISTLIVTMVLLGVVLIPPADAGPKLPRKVTRTETAEYTTSGSASTPTGSTVVCADDQGCLTFSVLAGEKYVVLEAIDTTGASSPFLVSTDGGTTSTAHCGATSAPIWLNKATEIAVSIASLSLPDCGGVSTTGTLSATFSNRP